MYLFFFIPISQYKKSNIIKYQPAGSRAACEDMLPTPFREPNPGGVTDIALGVFELIPKYMNKEIQEILREFCEEQRKPRSIALRVCFGLMPN